MRSDFLHRVSFQLFFAGHPAGSKSKLYSSVVLRVTALVRTFFPSRIAVGFAAASPPPDRRESPDGRSSRFCDLSYKTKLSKSIYERFIRRIPAPGAAHRKQVHLLAV